MVLRRLRRLDAFGFSMTDLLVTLAVASIVATMAWPWFSSFLKASRLKAAAQEVSTIVNGARQLAIARNVRVCITLSANSAVYRLNTSDACAGGTTYVGPLTKSDGTIPLSNDMQISATTANVIFTNLGNAAPGGTYTVRDPATNRTMSVIVALSGRVRIQ